MKVMAIFLGLGLPCGFTQDVAQLNVTSPPGVESFCEVMKNPKLLQDKPATLQSTAYILYGGILLRSDECKAPDVTVHYKKDYEKGSDAEALAWLKRFRREVHEAHLRGAGIEAERMIYVSVVCLRAGLRRIPFLSSQERPGCCDARRLGL